VSAFARKGTIKQIAIAIVISFKEVAKHWNVVDIKILLCVLIRREVNSASQHDAIYLIGKRASRQTPKAKLMCYCGVPCAHTHSAESHQDPRGHLLSWHGLDDVTGTSTESDAVAPLYVPEIFTDSGLPEYLFVIGKLVAKLPAGIVTEFDAGKAIAEGSLDDRVTGAPPAGADLFTVTRTLPDSFTPSLVGVVIANGGDAPTAKVAITELPS
jgi:hypothetical protein